jgi:hypothetical protein
MKSWHRMPVGCLFCIALLCLSASATVTITAHDPNISIDPENEVVAVSQTVTISYSDDITLSSADTFSFSAIIWNCYVNEDLNSNFPKTISAGTENSSVTEYPVGSGGFSFQPATAGSYSVYCTVSGDATPTSGSAASISGTTNTVTFTVSTCTGSVDADDDEQSSSDAAYTEMDFNLTPTMSPANSNDQDVTIGPYQGISGDLTAAGLDIDCEDDNNDDLPEQNAEITKTGQTSGSNSVTYDFTITQYGYNWDDCDEDSCPPPPAGAVEDVEQCTTSGGNCTSPGPATAQKTFSCGD